MWRSLLLLVGCTGAADAPAPVTFDLGVTSAPAPPPARFSGVLPGGPDDDPRAVLPVDTAAHRLCHDLGGARAQLESKVRSTPPEARGWFGTLLFQPSCEDPTWCTWIEAHLADDPVWWGGAWTCPALEARVFDDGPDWLVRDWIQWKAAPFRPRLRRLVDTTPDELLPDLLQGLARSADPRSRALVAQRDPGAARAGVPSRQEVVLLLEAGLDPRELPSRFAGYGTALGDVLLWCAEDGGEVWARSCAVAAVAHEPGHASRLAELFPELVGDRDLACAELGAAGFPCSPGAAGPTRIDLLEASGHARRIRGFVAEPGSANVYRLLAFVGLDDADAGEVVNLEDPGADHALLLWSGTRRFRVVAPATAFGDLLEPVRLVNAALAHAGRPERLQLEASGVRVVKGTPDALAALADAPGIELRPFPDPADDLVEAAPE